MKPFTHKDNELCSRLQSAGWPLENAISIVLRHNQLVAQGTQKKQVVRGKISPHILEKEFNLACLQDQGRWAMGVNYAAQEEDEKAMKSLYSRGLDDCRLESQIQSFYGSKRQEYGLGSR